MASQNIQIKSSTNIVPVTQPMSIITHRKQIEDRRNTYYFYRKPSIFGTFRIIFDISGYSWLDDINFSDNSNEIDNQSLYADWNAVGSDMRKSLLMFFHSGMNSRRKKLLREK